MLKDHTRSGSSDPVLARLARGEESALAEILDRHWAALVGYATRLLESADQAQDVAQEAFVRLWERRTGWTRDDAVRPILFRIARNLVIDQRRAALVRERWIARELEIDPPLVDLDEPIEAADLTSALEAALARLGAREREIVVLSRLHGLSRAEIAEVTGLAPGSISNLLSIGLTRLARALAPHLDRPVPAPRHLRRA